MRIQKLPSGNRSIHLLPHSRTAIHRHGRAVSFPCVLLLGLFALMLDAHAFPSWMGVYGSFQRHNGDNPGTFTILMNQDYWGLHADIGIRVDGGSWNVYGMNYAGHQDGNSIWVHQHSTAFPSNVTVEFYFHGYDNWGGNIWDSNNGNNYSFQSGPTVLQWIGNTDHWPDNTVLQAGDDLWINTETWARSAALNVYVIFSEDGAQWEVGPLSLAGQAGQNDWWHRYMGRFSAGTEMEYALQAVDGTGASHFDNNAGANYMAIFGVGDPAQWIGNARHFPTNGALTAETDLWLDIEAWPQNTTVGGAALYSVNGYAWHEEALEYNGVIGNNDWWHAWLGKQPPGSAVYYLFEIEDGEAEWHLHPTNGVPLVANVMGAATDTDEDGLPDDWELFWWGNLEDGGDGNYSGDGVAGVPLTDYLSYVIGVDPTVFTDHEEVPLLWFPDRPFRGGLVKLSFWISTNDPLHGGTIYARINQLDGQGAYDEELVPVWTSNGRYETTLPIATNAGSYLHVTLHNSLGATNDNHTLGWRVPLRNLGQGELADSSGDGMPDWWKIAHGLDPLDDGSINPGNGPDADLSGDGITNLEVFLAGGNPHIHYPIPEIRITYPKYGVSLP